MLVTNQVRYSADLDAVAAARPAHRSYMRQLRDQGRLAAGGPFEDGTGALFLYVVDATGAEEGDAVAQAEAIAAADPYTAAGVIAEHTLAPWHVVYARPELITPTD